MEEYFFAIFLKLSFSFLRKVNVVDVIGFQTKIKIPPFSG